MNVERWSVWLANLEPVIGSEQGKTRPVLVISPTRLNNVLPVINVLPLTSRKAGRRIYPNEALLPQGTGNLPNESLVLCYQIRTLDKQRLQREFGVVNDEASRESIIAAIKVQLEIA